MTIRRYCAADEARVRELTIEAFDGVSIDHNFDRLFGWDREPSWKARKWARARRVLRIHADDAFVAEFRGRVVGYVSCTVSNESRVGRIVDLAVQRGFRRRGLGTRLIERAVAHFRERGMALAKIETLEQNSAGTSLYPKLGFQEVARQIHYMMPLEPCRPDEAQEPSPAPD